MVAPATYLTIGIISACILWCAALTKNFVGLQTRPTKVGDYLRMHIGIWSVKKIFRRVANPNYKDLNHAQILADLFESR